MRIDNAFEVSVIVTAEHPHGIGGRPHAKANELTFYVACAGAPAAIDTALAHIGQTVSIKDEWSGKNEEWRVLAKHLSTVNPVGAIPVGVDILSPEVHKKRWLGEIILPWLEEPIHPTEPFRLTIEKDGKWSWQSRLPLAELMSGPWIES